MFFFVFFYRIGDSFTLSTNACTKCTCGPWGPSCNKTKCEPLPDSCFELVASHDECCPVCVTQGCNFNNITYNVGDVIKVRFLDSLIYITCENS